MILHRRFSKILKRGTLQNSYQIIPLMESVFNKIAMMNSRPAFCWKEVSILKRCYTRNFLKNVLLVFRPFSENNLWWSLFKIDLQSVHCRLETLLKQTPCWMFSWTFLRLFQSIIFRNIFICYMKVKITKITWMEIRCRKWLRPKRFSRNYQKKETRSAKNIWQGPCLPKFYATFKLQA